jgi:hypothetical protein
MARDGEVAILLSIFDVRLLVEGLDAYEYWQLGDVLPRNNGVVFIPGDLDPDADPYWGPHPEPCEAELEAIATVHVCRGLAERLKLAIDDR